MPRKPRRGCAYPGCPLLAVEGGQYCAEHKTIMAKRYDKYGRHYDIGKRYGRAWQRIRSRYVKTHPLCEQCLADGRLTPVEEVHHIVPLSKGGTHNESNLMSLCRSCHNKIHQQMGDRIIRR